MPNSASATGGARRLLAVAATAVSHGFVCRAEYGVCRPTTSWDLSAITRPSPHASSNLLSPPCRHLLTGLALASTAYWRWGPGPATAAKASSLGVKEQDLLGPKLLRTHRQEPAGASLSPPLELPHCTPTGSSSTPGQAGPRALWQGPLGIPWPQSPARELKLPALDSPATA